MTPFVTQAGLSCAAETPRVRSTALGITCRGTLVYPHFFHGDEDVVPAATRRVRQRYAQDAVATSDAAASSSASCQHRGRSHRPGPTQGLGPASHTMFSQLSALSPSVVWPAHPEGAARQCRKQK